MKSVLFRAGFWVALLHGALWTVITIESLGTRAASNYPTKILLLPRSELLQNAWIAYGLFGLGLIILFLVIFVWTERPVFRNVWRLNFRDNRSLFWNEIRFNVIGLALLLAVSVASIHANTWAFNYLWKLPESRAVGLIFDNATIKISTYAFEYEYFDGGLLRSIAGSNSPSAPSAQSSQREEGNEQESLESPDHSQGPSELASEYKGVMHLLNVMAKEREHDVIHILFLLHAALMVLLYLGFCNALRLRHGAMKNM